MLFRSFILNLWKRYFDKTWKYRDKMWTFQVFKKLFSYKFTKSNLISIYVRYKHYIRVLNIKVKKCKKVHDICRTFFLNNNLNKIEQFILRWNIIPFGCNMHKNKLLILGSYLKNYIHLVYIYYIHITYVFILILLFVYLV